MSPGATFDRVYLGLKEQLMSGRFAPGEHLEPVAIGDELHSSITPVRDALHRLVGERLVEAPRNDGFRVPMATELGLRQLYGWQVSLSRLATGRYQPASQTQQNGFDRDDAPASPAGVFLLLGRAAGDLELLNALGNACERLAAISLLEGRFINDLDAELESLLSALATGDQGALRSAIGAYQKRRDRAVPHIVEALQRTF